MKNRCVLHADLNGFFASVECFCNPAIRDKPVIVGGDEQMRHGIVLAKNEIAKRYGVKTAMTIREARQICPRLVSVPPDYDKYLKFSQIAREIYYGYTDQVEPFGVDEAWVDVTGSKSLFGDGKTIADEIREKLKKRIGITASIGVSFNKIFAKLGSDYKKPDATTVISRENYKDIAWSLPVSDLLYVGHATSRKLRAIGVHTIGELANLDVGILVSLLGKWGIVLKQFAVGDDSSPVKVMDAGNNINGIKSEKDVEYIKSVGNSTTLPRNVETAEDMKAVFYMLSDSVAARLRGHGLRAAVVQIYLRDCELSGCERQGRLDYPSNISGELARRAMEIYEESYVMVKPLRTIGVRGCNLVSDRNPQQIDLFSQINRRIKQESAERCMDHIRETYGFESINKGIIYIDRKLTGINAKDDHIIHPINYFDSAIL